MAIDEWEAHFTLTSNPLVVEAEYKDVVYQCDLLNPIPPAQDFLEFSHNEWVKTLEASGSLDMLDYMRTDVPREKPGRVKKLTAKQKKEIASAELEKSVEIPPVPVFGKINPLPKKRAKKK